MDKEESLILDALQNDFPLSQEPYAILADKLQMPLEQLWERIEKLIDEGIIRRIGASLDSRKLGFCSTLAAVSVEKEKVEIASEVIGKFPEVTHSYLRNDKFNMWFTIIAIDSQRIADILEQIRMSLKLESEQVLNLPMKSLFKLNARFNVPG